MAGVEALSVNRVVVTGYDQRPVRPTEDEVGRLRLTVRVIRDDDSCRRPRRARVDRHAVVDDHLAPGTGDPERAIKVDTLTLTMEERRRHVPVRRLPKQRRRVPLIAARPEPASDECHFPPRFPLTAEPHREQVPVWALDDRGTMVMPREHGPMRFGLDMHVPDGIGEE